jgi:hypothetical protein
MPGAALGMAGCGQGERRRAQRGPGSACSPAGQAPEITEPERADDGLDVGDAAGALQSSTCPAAR